MKVITVAREYGAGGSEVARQLVEKLGWELLDRELLHQAAEIEQVPDAELARLDEKAVSLADRFHVHPPYQRYIHALTAAVGRAAARGAVVLVGRGARHLLGETTDAFHLRLVAPQEWRAKRMSRLEGWSPTEAQMRCAEVDRARERFTRFFFGSAATQPAQYDLVVNTGRVPLEDVTSLVAAMVCAKAAEEVSHTSTGRRVLTLSRELGAGDSGFAPVLAERLKMQVYDRELLEQEAVRLGVSELDIERIDERPIGIFERLQPGSSHQHYVEVLEQYMVELAERGDVILVGRGGNRLLREDPRAFHVRLVAPLAVRWRRVMEYRWVREAVAKKLVAESDAQRRRFHETCFGIDWSDPLEYHMTVNTGRLGAGAIDLVASAGSHFWSR